MPVSNGVGSVGADGAMFLHNATSIQAWHSYHESRALGMPGI